MRTVKIRENSWLARIAAKRMKTKKIALVFGSTIHLYNVPKENFLSNKRWLRHELAHVQQYQELGKVKFLFHYFFESFNKGHEMNRFELEAQQAELRLDLEKKFQIL